MTQMTETPHADVLQLLTGHFHEPSGYRAYRPNGVGDWLLILTLSGQGRFGHARGDLVAGEGDWVLLAPGTLHDYGVASGAGHWELLWAHFRPRVDWHDWLHWPRIEGGLMRLRPAGGQAEMAAQFAQVHRLHAGGGRRAEALAMNALEKLLLDCDMHNPPASGPLDNRVRRAMHIMETRYAEKLSLNEMAREAGLSLSRLSHLFRAETGVTVQAYLEAIRMRRAADLLRRTGFPVKQVAAALGYESPFYFSRRFALATGQSPLAYRRGFASQ